MPPYIDVISGLFSANIMRKPSTYVPLIPSKEKKGLAKVATQHSQISSKAVTPRK